ncbi:MAG TPA: patatin-like phospholipase RssA [Candidatus Competibacteraceae bacterium]|nr:patatin-like phospholipase RssA [Candidatus Competibacteraceae bacterium]
MAALRIGIALGSGSARGWAHIGVLRALEEQGIVPDIVCGTSIGAAVGAAYASGRLDPLESWVRELTRWDMLRLLDWSSVGMEGERLMQAFCERVPDVAIESLARPFGAVATDLASGREVWLTHGSLQQAVRASIALPGLFSPLRHKGRWLVDGGLVDPVPVALCRALGADRVIAVNLNGDLLSRQFLRRPRLPSPGELLDSLGQRLQQALGNGGSGRSETGARRETVEPPNLFDTMAYAMHIMQDRITRSRLAGDPPDVVLTPRLGQLALFDFHRAEEAIAAGRDCAERYRAVLADVLQAPDPAAGGG